MPTRMFVQALPDNTPNACNRSAFVLVVNEDIKKTETIKLQQIVGSNIWGADMHATILAVEVISLHRARLCQRAVYYSHRARLCHRAQSARLCQHK